MQRLYIGFEITHLSFSRPELGNAEVAAFHLTNAATNLEPLCDLLWGESRSQSDGLLARKVGLSRRIEQLGNLVYPHLFCLSIRQLLSCQVNISEYTRSMCPYK